MSKNGRALADIRKMKSVSAAKTIGDAESGTIYTITGADTDYTITLPKLGNIPNGWHIEFLLGATGSANVNICCDDDNANSMVGLISPIENTGSFVGGSVNTAYFLSYSTASFVVAQHHAQLAGLYSRIKFLAVSDSNWNVDATCFRPGFITGSAS
jgi:hypothetical protein